jgi:hypothetical protein
LFAAPASVTDNQSRLAKDRDRINCRIFNVVITLRVMSGRARNRLASGKPVPAVVGRLDVIREVACPNHVSASSFGVSKISARMSTE